MDAKILITILIAINCYCSCGAALRRTPKVYNALITTDENLTSSRAFPVIQPTIHESGVAHYPFGPFNPYGFYTPPFVRFGQPIVPGLAPNRQIPYPLPQQRFPPQFMRQPPPNSGPQLLPAPDAAAQQAPPQEAATVIEAAAAAATAEASAQPPTDEQQPVQPPALPPLGKVPPSPYIPPLEQLPPKQMPEEKLPIALNEFGLPPSLIPLQQHQQHQYQYQHQLQHQFVNRGPNGPLSIPPYGFSQYPLIYDPITGYREQYLPPYDYFPNPQQHQHFALGGGAGHIPKPALPAPTATTPPQEQQQQQQQPSSQDGAEETAASEPQPQTEIQPQPNEVLEEAQLPGGVDFESIKNASKNKNSAVPDVPPPPLPSGAKTTQQQQS